MKITLKLFADLRRCLPEGAEGHAAELSIGSGTTVGEMLAERGVDTREKLIILVNGKHEELDYKLDEGDVLAVFPPIAGG